MALSLGFWLCSRRRAGDCGNVRIQGLGSLGAWCRRCCAGSLGIAAAGLYIAV